MLYLLCLNLFLLLEVAAEKGSMSIFQVEQQ